MLHRLGRIIWGGLPDELLKVRCQQQKIREFAAKFIGDSSPPGLIRRGAGAMLHLGKFRGHPTNSGTVAPSPPPN